MDAVRQLVNGDQQDQLRGQVDHFGVGGEESRNDVTERDERDGGEEVPGDDQVVGGLCRQSQLLQAAGAVAVGDADGRGGTDRSYDHEGAVAQGHGDLVGADGRLAQPAHHDTGADEGRGFEKHLQGDWKAHTQQCADRFDRIVAGRESLKIGAVFLFFVEIADNHDRHGDARSEGAEPRTRGTQFFESEVAVDENPVQADVHQVAENHHDHFDPGVSDAFEELLEGKEKHDERHAVSQQLVIRYGHIDHFDGLSHVVHQRDDGQLEAADQESQQCVEHHAVLQVLRRFVSVALGVEFADQRREAQCDADAGDEEDEEDMLQGKFEQPVQRERSGGQRRGVVASVTADHDVVGDLYEDLPQLGHHDGQGQFQIGFVLLFVG